MLTNCNGTDPVQIDHSQELGHIQSNKRFRFQIIDKVKEVTDLLEQTEEWRRFKQAEFKMEHHSDAQKLLTVVKLMRNRFSQISLRHGYEHPESVKAQKEYEDILEKMKNIPVIDEYQAYQEDLNELVQGVIAAVMSSLSSAIKVERGEEAGEIACGTDKGGCGHCSGH